MVAGHTLRCAQSMEHAGVLLHYTQVPARPSPLCNLIRPGSVKEFAQCFRAQA